MFAVPIGSGRYRRHPSRGAERMTLSLLDLGRPAFDALAAAADGDVELDVVHADGPLQEVVSAHAAGVCAPLGLQVEHGQQEVRDALGLVGAEVVLFAQHVGQRPVAQAVDIAQLALAVENLLRPFPADAQRLWEGAEQLDDLGNVVVVLAVLCAGLGIEEVVAGDELENLGLSALPQHCNCRVNSPCKPYSIHPCLLPTWSRESPLATGIVESEYRL